MTFIAVLIIIVLSFSVYYDIYVYVHVMYILSTINLSIFSNTFLMDLDQEK